MKSVSVAMPVHNDAAYLPYSLGSLIGYAQELAIKELVIVLDRCTDDSAMLVREFEALVDYPVIVLYKTKQTWKHGIAEAFEKAFQLCRGRYIHTMAADIITDGIRHPLKPDILSMSYLHSKNGLVSPHNAYLNLLNKLPFIYNCQYGKWSGLFCMKRKVWGFVATRRKTIGYEWPRRSELRIHDLAEVEN